MDVSGPQSCNYDTYLERLHPPHHKTASFKQYLIHFLILKVLKYIDNCGSELLISGREQCFSQNWSKASQSLRHVLVNVFSSSGLYRKWMVPMMLSEMQRTALGVRPAPRVSPEVRSHWSSSIKPLKS